MSKEYTQADVQAAWNDGYEAAKEEEGIFNPFIPPDKMKAIFDTLSNRLALKRVEGNEELNRKVDDIRRSLTLDYVMSAEEVRMSWDDAFLTNVMVPYLEHIKDEVRDRQIQMLSRISQQGHPVTDEQTEAYKSLVHDANSLTQVIHILKEWRG